MRSVRLPPKQRGAGQRVNPARFPGESGRSWGTFPSKRAFPFQLRRAGECLREWASWHYSAPAMKSQGSLMMNPPPFMVARTWIHPPVWRRNPSQDFPRQEYRKSTILPCNPRPLYPFFRLLSSLANGQFLS